jgi:DNA-binding MarR family transcriptional regulator
MPISEIKNMNEVIRISDIEGRVVGILKEHPIYGCSVSYVTQRLKILEQDTRRLLNKLITRGFVFRQISFFFESTTMYKLTDLGVYESRKW